MIAYRERDKLHLALDRHSNRCKFVVEHLLCVRLRNHQHVREFGSVMAEIHLEDLLAIAEHRHHPSRVPFIVHCLQHSALSEQFERSRLNDQGARKSLTVRLSFL